MEDESYIRILENAHKILLPDKKFQYDVINECHMIRNAIINLWNSDREDKHEILLKLARQSGIKINHDAPLINITKAVADYYTDTCLAIGPDVAVKLGLLWGMGVRSHVSNYKDLCISISKKIDLVYGNEFGPSIYVITILFDPEIGLITGLEYKIKGAVPYNTENQIKTLASDIIIWKINTHDKLDGIYDGYQRNLNNMPNHGGIIPQLSDYVSKSPMIAPKERDFFLQYHNHKELDNPQMIKDQINENFQMSFEDSDIESPKMTDEEANFILTVYNRFITGEYPIDMKWNDLCMSL